MIRTPNGRSANFLGSRNGSEEGKAVFYHDVEVQGNLILGGSSIQTQLEAKQAKVANVSDTEIRYLDGVTSSIQSHIDNHQVAFMALSPLEQSYDTTIVGNEILETIR